MIDKLNFSGANPNFNIESPQSSTGDTLLNLGKYYSQKDALEQERLAQAKRDEYRISRDMIADERYDADKKLQADEKARLLNKEYNTGRAALALTDPESLKKEAMAGEQKAIEQTLASATPEERLKIQQELKGYNPKESAQGWIDTAMGQSNVDANMISNLKRDIVKQKADEAYKQDSLALQREQNAIAAGARADQRSLDERKLKLEEDKINAPKKEDIKAAQIREGLVARFKDAELKLDKRLTNEQLEDVLKEKLDETKDIKKEQKKLLESGNFMETPKESVQAQRNKFLRDSLSGTNGTTFKSVEDEIKKDQDKIDRFLLNAKLKLGKENYSDKQVLSMIANERKNQSVSAPWDTGMQDALESVAEQLGMTEQDF